MRNKIKKILLFILFTILIFGAGAYADSQLHASDVLYEKEDGTKVQVQNVIDELVATKPMTVEVTNGYAIYTGTSTNGDASIKVVNPSGSATIKYGTAKGTYNLTSIPKYTDAGTYTVYYQATASNYATNEGSFKIVISKKINYLSLAESASSRTLGQTVKTSIINPSGGTLSVTSSNSGVATATISGTTLKIDSLSVGSVTITVTSAETTNYEPSTTVYTLTVKAITEVKKDDTEKYVGFYADIDDDGTVDGIIYADLLHGNYGDGVWNNKDTSNATYNSRGTYVIPTKEASTLKDYYISQDSYTANNVFGTKPVISPKAETTGDDRFYVMSLSDLNSSTLYDWFNAAYGKMGDYASFTSRNFGTGKENTRKMIARWNLGEGSGIIDGTTYTGYGAQNACGSHLDMWGVLDTQVVAGWFVPSSGEWSAFAEELEITTSNYSTAGLKDWYWSSSQHDTSHAYTTYFSYSYVSSNYSVYNNRYVRLSATF